jgi:hypothetical protein
LEYDYIDDFIGYEINIASKQFYNLTLIELSSDSDEEE